VQTRRFRKRDTARTADAWTKVLSIVNVLQDSSAATRISATTWTVLRWETDSTRLYKVRPAFSYFLPHIRSIPGIPATCHAHRVDRAICTIVCQMPFGYLYLIRIFAARKISGPERIILMKIWHRGITTFFISSYHHVFATFCLFAPREEFFRGISGSLNWGSTVLYCKSVPGGKISILGNNGITVILSWGASYFKPPF